MGANLIFPHVCKSYNNNLKNFDYNANFSIEDIGKGFLENPSNSYFVVQNLLLVLPSVISILVTENSN